MSPCWCLFHSKFFLLTDEHPPGGPGKDLRKRFSGEFGCESYYRETNSGLLGFWFRQKCYRRTDDTGLNPIKCPGNHINTHTHARTHLTRVTTVHKITVFENSPLSFFSRREILGSRATSRRENVEITAAKHKEGKPFLQKRHLLRKIQNKKNSCTWEWKRPRQVANFIFWLLFSFNRQWIRYFIDLRYILRIQMKHTQLHSLPWKLLNSITSLSSSGNT